MKVNLFSILLLFLLISCQGNHKPEFSEYEFPNAVSWRIDSNSIETGNTLNLWRLIDGKQQSLRVKLCGVEITNEEQARKDLENLINPEVDNAEVFVAYNQEFPDYFLAEVAIPKPQTPEELIFFSEHLINSASAKFKSDDNCYNKYLYQDAQTKLN
jgi:hypothetical protein